MKAGEAHEKLRDYTGDDLYREARKLYISETDTLIKARCGEKPSAQCIEGCLKQVSQWFLKAARGLAWSEEELPNKIIEWERGRPFVEHRVLDPRIAALRKRTLREMGKGSPLPVLTALKDGDLEAGASMMLAVLSKQFEGWDELRKARKAFADKFGKIICPFGEEKRTCEHQETYVLDPDALPTKTSNLVFTCKLPKCVDEGR